MKISCLIIDDEPIARKIIEEFIQDVDFLNLEGLAENPLKATSILMEKQIDLIFLDIEMPKISGINFLKSLIQPPMVIMTTAYPNYALESFELSVMDYLVKPIAFDRFLKAVFKAKKFYELKNKALNNQTSDYFFIKSEQKIEKIVLKELLYVEALSNYIKVYTVHKKYVCYLTSKGIEEQLPKDSFVRIHKSYLVSINAITSLEGNEVQLINGVKLPISRHYKDDVMKIIGKLVFKR